jgi:DNA-binding SARP family transcriptional activator
MFLALMYRRPEHPDIRSWMERVLLLAGRSPNIDQKIQLYLHPVIYLMCVGHYRRAALISNELKEMARSSTGLMSIQAKLVEAMSASLFSNAASEELALRPVFEGLEMAREEGISLLNHQLYGYGFFICLKWGNLTGARIYMERMRPLNRPDQRMDIAHYHYNASWLAMLEGNIDRSTGHATVAMELAELVGCPFIQSSARFALLQFLYEAGKRREAKIHLSRLLRDARQLKSAYLEFNGLLLDAYFNLRAVSTLTSSAVTDNGVEILRRAMTLGSAFGIENFTFWRPSIMSFLSVKALEAGIELDYVRGLIQNRRLVPDSPPLECDAWPWPIRIYTLGRFVVFKDAEPLVSGGKTQRRPLELLQALIALGPRDVSEIRLMEALWPESEGDKAKHAFESTLSRLRKLMGVDQALVLQDGRLTLDLRRCWIDSVAFQHLLDRAETAGKALELYQGRFLDDVEASWVLSRRETLHDRFLKHLGKTTHSVQDNGDLEQTLIWCRKGLEIDELADVLYRRMMTAYADLGQHAEAISVYERCRRVFNRKLGIEPSPETHAVYLKIAEDR